jgi:4-amino-4-deoxy-L-arabinose transferase-like glycosyltransferase
LPRALIWILVLAFALRLTMLLPATAHPERALPPDSATYLAYARAMLHGQGWEYPSAMRTPGYPAFLALGSLLFGQTVAGLVAVQILVGVFSVLLTYLLGRALLDEATGLLAALLLALSAESITHSLYLLSETLFTCLFLAAIYALWRSRHETGWIWPAASGLLLGASILTRPLAGYFPLLAFPLLFWERSPIRLRLRKAAAFLAASLLLVLPWLIRNASIVGAPTLSTISGDYLLYYNAASLEADRSGRSESQVREDLRDRVQQVLDEGGLPATEVNQARVEADLAWQIILADPVRYAGIHLRDDLNSLLPDTDPLEIWGLTIGERGTLEVLKQEGLGAAIRHYFAGRLWTLWLLVPTIALLCLTYLGWAAGSLRLLFQRRIYPLLLLSLPIAYGLLLPGSPSNPRFRVPVMPYVCVLAALGLLSAWQRFAKRKVSKT